MRQLELKTLLGYQSFVNDGLSGLPVVLDCSMRPCVVEMSLQNTNDTISDILVGWWSLSVHCN